MKEKSFEEWIENKSFLWILGNILMSPFYIWSYLYLKSMKSIYDELKTNDQIK